MHRYAAARFELASGVGVLHIGPHFGNVHATIAIKDGEDGFSDMRFGQNELEVIACWQFDALDSFLWALADTRAAFSLGGDETILFGRASLWQDGRKLAVLS